MCFVWAFLVGLSWLLAFGVGLILFGLLELCLLTVLADWLIELLVFGGFLGRRFVLIMLDCFAGWFGVCGVYRPLNVTCFLTIFSGCLGNYCGDDC